MRRIIVMKFAVEFDDQRSEAEREPVEQMVDAIAYSIDTGLMHSLGIKWTTPTQVVEWEEQPVEPAGSERKPGIIVLSTDDEPAFRWMSDGWNSISKRGSESKALMTKAHLAIEAGTDVPDTVRLLTEAGFDVRRA